MEERSLEREDEAVIAGRGGLWPRGKTSGEIRFNNSETTRDGGGYRRYVESAWCRDQAFATTPRAITLFWEKASVRFARSGWFADCLDAQNFFSGKATIQPECREFHEQELRSVDA
jgi:hypothetical protein